MTDAQKIVIEAYFSDINPLPAIPTIKQARIEGAIAINGALNGLSKQNKSYQLPTAKTPDPSIGLSSLNTPIWDKLIIQGDTYDDSILGTIKYADIFLETVLITITQQHNVILTSIQGRDGEVIEYASKQSFRISIKGGLFGTGFQRPAQDIQNLRNMLGSNKPLVIKQSNFLTSEWKINEMAVLTKNIPQSMGGYNYQLFEFSCIENVPVILAQNQVK